MGFENPHHTSFWRIDRPSLIKLIRGYTTSILCNITSGILYLSPTWNAPWIFFKETLSSKIWQEPKTVIFLQLEAMRKKLTDYSSLWLITSAYISNKKFLCIFILSMIPFYLTCQNQTMPHKCSTSATTNKAQKNGETGQEVWIFFQSQPQLKYTLLQWWDFLFRRWQ